MTPRFLLMTRLPEPGLGMLREAGEVVDGADVGGDAALARLVASGDYDVVVAALDQKFTADVLADARIRGIANYAVGYNNVAMAIALRAASSAIAARVSRVAEPRCGRSITFSSSARPGARAGSSS